jgi:hypothetical protein
MERLRKRCERCGGWRRGKNGSCADCHAAYCREYRRSHRGAINASNRAYRKENPAATREGLRKWREKNQHKHRAHWTVSAAIASGKLKRLACEVCGSENSHAHHEDYAKPLEVRWLCPLHHSKVHQGRLEQRVKKLESGR